MPKDAEALRLFAMWCENWKNNLLDRTDEETAISRMEAYNPIVIPRNLIVDEAIKLAEMGDYTKFKSLFLCLQEPYNYDFANLVYIIPPESKTRFVTYCGT